MTRKLELPDVLAEEYDRLRTPPCGGVPPKRSRTRLANLYAQIHRDAAAGRKRTALCFSGGGIRSATFALGVVQELARRRILTQFDYLSTVSGGGYIGSWLSSYARRRANGIEDVANELAATRIADPMKPEPEPLVNLRKYSNYLTPKLGLFSGDTWALVATYVRNLLLVWLILLPLLAGLLALPRLVIAILYKGQSAYCAPVAAVLLTLAVGYLAWTRPVGTRVKRKWIYTNTAFIAFALLPMFAASVLLALRWAQRPFKDWWLVYVALMGIALFSSVVHVLRFAFAARTEPLADARRGEAITWFVLKKAFFEVVAAGVSGCAAAALLQFSALKLLPREALRRIARPDQTIWQEFPAKLPELTTLLHATFGVPLILCILFLQAALFVGIASAVNEEYDREWWARAAGWVLLAAVAWAAFASITIFGPVLIYTFPKIAGALGIGTGFGAILGGRGAASSAAAQKGAAKEKGDSKVSLGGVFDVGLGVLASAFAVFVLALLSLITTELLIERNADRDKLRSSEYVLYTSAQYQRTEAGTDVTIRNQKFHRTLVIPNTPAMDVYVFRALRHYYILDNTPAGSLLVVVLLFPVLAVVASFSIRVNQFSMHAMYRNRLIRAYLGASQPRDARHANPFTGFDPNDNFAMHRLRPETFWEHSFRDPAGVIQLLRQPATGSLAAYVRAHLTSRTQRLIEDASAAEATVCESLADDLNVLIDEHDLSTLPPKHDPDGATATRALANRVVLQNDSDFKTKLHRCPSGKPFHVINTTLNLVAGKELAWQERKASSFTVTPLHSGNSGLGYRQSREYGGAGGISLGTAVAISGAAASPNMGYHSSPALSFLLTLFNVRLGWWLGNPNDDDTYHLRNPRSSLRPLVDELRGSTDDTHPYVYLSDGGHFENLGLYEMVLRRCHLIVISDGGADYSFGFDDLGNAVRKIQIDMGIPITFTSMNLFARSVEKPDNPKYCAVATIDYKAVDGPAAEQGTLLYVKPAILTDLKSKNVGVYNYAQQSPQFPHESTADQFFSESQFESYRALGELTVRDICDLGKLQKHSVEGLIAAANQYVRL
ncbi:MAG: patatin-like phospholipase family protein [Acidobacteriota bacterium]|nr:patatin-like phospholipase family protein [Acidobacteriota bacterium]